MRKQVLTYHHEKRARAAQIQTRNAEILSKDKTIEDFENYEEEIFFLLQEYELNEIHELHRKESFRRQLKYKVCNFYFCNIKYLI